MGLQISTRSIGNGRWSVRFVFELCLLIDLLLRVDPQSFNLFHHEIQTPISSFLGLVPGVLGFQSWEQHHEIVRMWVAGSYF
jgi:hypothetical protein